MKELLDAQNEFMKLVNRDLHPVICSEIETLIRIINKAIECDQTAKIGADIIASYNSTLKDDFGCVARLSAGFQWGQEQGVLIMLDSVKDVDHIKPLFVELGKRGFILNGTPEDYLEAKRRTWKFKRRDDGTTKKDEIKLLAFFHDENAKCRYVQVGVEEKPIYKLMCDGDVEVKDASDKAEQNKTTMDNPPF